jgi:hypothetical protein
LSQTLLEHEGNNHLHVGFVGLLVDHLDQMDGQRCHLVQKQGDDYENAFICSGQLLPFFKTCFAVKLHQISDELPLL